MEKTWVCLEGIARAAITVLAVLKQLSATPNAKATHSASAGLEHYFLSSVIAPPGIEDKWRPVIWHSGRPNRRCEQYSGKCRQLYDHAYYKCWLLPKVLDLPRKQ